MTQEQIHHIQVVNFAYDTRHQLTKVIYRGREAVIATELGRFLGYTNNGSRLVQMITIGRWADRFREGVDYEMLKGQDLQEFLEALSHGERVHPTFSHLMILYISGIHLVLLNTSKPVGTNLHRWLVDEVFPSLKATGSYHLHPLDQKALPPTALFVTEIRTALSKIRNAHIAGQKEHAQPRDFAMDWDATHRAHTAPMFNGFGKTSQQIKAVARQRGLKVPAHKSARQLLFEMEDFRHANVSESAEIDLERIGVARERARRIAITQGQPYFKALVEAGVDQASLEEYKEVK
jgi:prophage antirepressor-like protein